MPRRCGPRVLYVPQRRSDSDTLWLDGVSMRCSETVTTSTDILNLNEHHGHGRPDTISTASTKSDFYARIRLAEIRLAPYCNFGWRHPAFPTDTREGF
jgi:hypothetical protein